MSTQNIFELNKQELYDKADRAIMCMANSLMIKEKFGIGDGYNEDDFDVIEKLQNIVCEENCRLCLDNRYAQEKLNLMLSKYS